VVEHKITISTTSWILRRIASDVLAHSRDSDLKSLAARIVRSLRVLFYLSDHKKLLRLDVVRKHLVSEWNTDLFHHLSRRGYLIEDLSMRKRIDYVYLHYWFEEHAFDQRYKTRLYSKEGGLPLWEREMDCKRFSITLTTTPWWAAPEGELSISLLVDGKTVHYMSFNWIDGGIAGLSQPIVPFIGCNQGASLKVQQEMAVFNQAFPNNSPRFFCFAAIQGVAKAIGSTHVVAVKCNANIQFKHKDKNNFVNAYDEFWTSLGGMEMPCGKYLIALPFYAKPLEKISAKHRKRASIRRSFWNDISNSAQENLRSHVIVSESLSTASRDGSGNSDSWIIEGIASQSRLQDRIQKQGHNEENRTEPVRQLQSQSGSSGTT
jgi:uncharacterized protein VirK/YbjX